MKFLIYKWNSGKVQQQDQLTPINGNKLNFHLKNIANNATIDQNLSILA